MSPFASLVRDAQLGENEPQQELQRGEESKTVQRGWSGGYNDSCIQQITYSYMLALEGQQTGAKILRKLEKMGKLRLEATYRFAKPDLYIFDLVATFPDGATERYPAFMVGYDNKVVLPEGSVVEVKEDGKFTEDVDIHPISAMRLIVDYEMHVPDFQISPLSRVEGNDIVFDLLVKYPDDSEEIVRDYQRGKEPYTFLPDGRKVPAFGREPDVEIGADKIGADNSQDTGDTVGNN